MLNDTNKRGISDAILWVPFLFVAGIILIAGFIVMSQANTAIQDSNTLNNETKAFMAEQATDYPKIFDAIFVMFFFALILASFLLSTILDTNPGLFFISLLVFVIVLIVGAMVANSFIDVTSEDTISGYAAYFPMTMFIFNHYLTVLIVYVALLSLVIWGKVRQ